MLDTSLSSRVNFHRRLVGLVQRETLAYVAAHGDANDVCFSPMGMRSNEICNAPGRLVGRARFDVTRRRVQREIRQQEVEVRKMWNDERILEARSEASVEKDDGGRFVVVE